jgi:hypothetical protein
VESGVKNQLHVGMSERESGSSDGKWIKTHDQGPRRSPKGRATSRLASSCSTGGAAARGRGLESGIDFTFCSTEVAGAQHLGDGLNRTYLP